MTERILHKKDCFIAVGIGGDGRVTIDLGDGITYRVDPVAAEQLALGIQHAAELIAGRETPMTIHKLIGED